MAEYLYFYITYTLKKKEEKENNFISRDNFEQIPKCILSYETNKSNLYKYNKVFKIIKSEKKLKKYSFEFEINDYRYIISFEGKGKTFVFNVNLKFGFKCINILFEINQNNIDYSEKLDFFIRALELNGETENINKLFKDAINLIQKRNNFSFLISLFIKIYQMEDLCPLLLEKFKKIIFKIESMDIKEDLKNYISKFNEIAIEANNIIEKNNYDIISFYGIILIYSNYFDYKKFLSIFDLLYEKKPETLYEILLAYGSCFINQINQSKEFFSRFLNYTINKKDFSFVKIGLNYITDLETFIIILLDIKEKIAETIKSGGNFGLNKYKIELNKYLNLINIENSEKKSNLSVKSIRNIIENINQINDFCKKKKIFFLNIQNDFWNYLFNYCKEPKMDNIIIIRLMRESFIKYYYLVIERFQNVKKLDIKTEAIKFYERDELSFYLDKIITIVISKNNYLTNLERLYLLSHYNPYFYEIKYFYKITPNFLDLFDFNNISNDNEFIEAFRKMNFEKIFQKNIVDYIHKIISKIKTISDFNLIKLINVDSYIKNIILNLLKFKYDIIINKEIESLNDNELVEAIKVIAYLVMFFTFYEKNEKESNFINISFIDKLSKNIKASIYIEIIKIINNKELRKNTFLETEIEDINDNKEENCYYKKLKEFIINKFIIKVDNIIHLDKFINIIINLQNQLSNTQEKEEFFEKLLSENSFTKEEFFSSKKSNKIELFYNLYEKGIIKNDNSEYSELLFKLLNEIEKSLGGIIQKKELNEFLLNNESIIIKRLSLIKLISKDFDPHDIYERLKIMNNNVNNDLKKLVYIKDNLLIYHSSTYKEIINQITDIIQGNLSIIKYYPSERTGEELIKIYNNFNALTDKINKVKNFLLFNEIYQMQFMKDEISKFNFAYNKLEEIDKLLKEKADVNELYGKNKKLINNILKKIGYDKEKIEECINCIIEYYNITNENLIDDINILFMSKKYEYDLNCISFFFKSLEVENSSLSIELGIINSIKSLFSNMSLNEANQEKEKDDVIFNIIKKQLIQLKNEGIYDYKNIQYYIRFFNCFYNKKEAIDFLLGNDFNLLKEELQSIDNIINIINIQDLLEAEICRNELIRMINVKKKKEIIFYIKNLEQKTIEYFEKYSQNYKLFIESFINNEYSKEMYTQISNIMNDSSFGIFLDSERFIYKDKGEIKHITLEKLIQLKNKIHIKKECEEKFQKGNTDETILKKSEILTQFKNIISNLEIIMNNINIIRIKGGVIPIGITIRIYIKNSELSIIYYLDYKEVSLETIKTFLFNAKSYLISHLDFEYKVNLYLRFLYGKQFRIFLWHLEKDYNIEPFLRYILNITDNNINIIEGSKIINRQVTNYINYYQLFIKDSLESIFSYIISIFKNNNITIEEHYNSLKINSHPNKGIYIFQCYNNSTEEFIIKLFLDKTNNLPMAQNLLFINKDTSDEEIQAFLYRAILCSYNTIFVIKFNDSISDEKQNTMISYINILLKYKRNRVKSFKKQDTENYLDSYIAFICCNYNHNITSFLYKIGNFDEYSIKNFTKDINVYKNRLCSKLGNVIVVTSEISGLGKSKIIKNMIKEKGKKYFYFQIGGILNKDCIYDKVRILFKKMKNFKDIGIHLDLTDSNETEIINEFLFSFLITKFYINKGDIIYIPKDIFIYVEIQNCFPDLLSKFSILNIFNKYNITLENMPDFDFPNNIINIFNLELGIDSNEKIKEFVNKYIGISRYSFCQINIFIKLFISQFSHDNKKINFLELDKDKKEEYIQDFSKYSLYFTNHNFAKILTEKDLNCKNDKKNFIHKIEETYEKDLINKTFTTPLLYINTEKMIYDKFYFLEENSNRYKNTKDYLRKLKEILYLPNEVEKDTGQLKSLFSILEEKENKYIITNDNFNKMIFLNYIIKANIPVIIMGEEGIGKTSLIIQLNKLLNNGNNNVEIINLNYEITEENIYEFMEQINTKAKKQKNEEYWVVFDEINTCFCLSLITEIFINRSYNMNEINDNIRLIGTCATYRKKIYKKRQNGVIFSDDNFNDYELINEIQPLPQSLLYYVFNFGFLNEENENKYIYSIIEKIFIKGENNMHKSTAEAIFKCHRFLRSKNFDLPIVSLRDINIFLKFFEFFDSYFIKKNKYEKRINNEKNNKLKSIICSIYLCYYFRLEDDETRSNFEYELRGILFELINNRNEEKKYKTFIEQIENKDFKSEILTYSRYINKFSDFIKIEFDFLINQLELNKDIAKNNCLKENLFFSFISIITNIPLIMIGKPGTSKSLSIQLIANSMRGKYSKNPFFYEFPKIIQTYYQGSKETNLEDVKNLFEIAMDKIKYYKNDKELSISLVIFDELGLAYKTERKILNILNSKLELESKRNYKISFIGISNYSLQLPRKFRGITLSVPDINQKFDVLNEITLSIAENYIYYKNDNIIYKILKILSHTYYEYKKRLQYIKDFSFHDSEKSKDLDKINKILKKLLEKEYNIKIDFHGLRDFYNLINGIAYNLNKCIQLYMK